MTPNPEGLAKSRNQKAHSDSNISIGEIVKKVGNRLEAESIEYVDKMTSPASTSYDWLTGRMYPVTLVASSRDRAGSPVLSGQRPGQDFTTTEVTGRHFVAGKPNKVTRIGQCIDL